MALSEDPSGHSFSVDEEVEGLELFRLSNVCRRGLRHVTQCGTLEPFLVPWRFEVNDCHGGKADVLLWCEGLVFAARKQAEDVHEAPLVEVRVIAFV